MCLALILGAAGCRSDRTLTAVEIRQVFSDKTVRGYQEADGSAFGFKRYFAPNGTAWSQEWDLSGSRLAVRSNPEGAAVPGKWWIRADSSLCASWQEVPAEHCGLVVTDFINQYRQVRLRPDGTRILTMTFLKLGSGNEVKR